MDSREIPILALALIVVLINALILYEVGVQLFVLHDPQITTFACANGTVGVCTNLSFASLSFTAAKIKPTLTLSKGGKFKLYDNVVFSISGTNGQVVASLYVDGSVVATTTSSNTYEINIPGTYTIQEKSPAGTGYKKATTTLRTVTITAPGNAIPGLSYSNGNNILLGTSDNITASCVTQSVNDNCALFYGSTELANAPGSITYNAGLLAAGVYNIFADDLTDLKASGVNTLVVSAPVITPNAIPSLSYSNGNSIVVGMPDNITANCTAQSMNDVCGIWYSGLELANGIGSITYNAGILGAGNYEFYANDSTDNETSAVNTLVVSNQIPITTVTVNAPAGIKYYVAINLTNNQTIPTAVPFQQHFQINMLNYTPVAAGDLQNIEFFYANGTIIPSWLEFNNTNISVKTDYWLKVYNGIPALGNVTVYMGFAPQGTSLFDGVNVGEAPEMGALYAYANGHPYRQYDNGANVFTTYYNFAGTSLPGGWTTLNSPSYSVNNGVALSPSGQSSPCKNTELIAPGTYTQGTVLDVYGWFAGHPNGAGNSCEQAGFSLGTSSLLNSVAIGQVVKGQLNLYASNMISSSTAVMQYQNVTPLVYSLGYNSITASGSENYNTSLESIMGPVPTVPTSMILFTETNMKVYAQWARTRAYPPNGVMPSAKLGCIASAATGTCSAPVVRQLNNYYYYNVSGFVQATSPVNDILDFYVDGNYVTSGTSITYNAALLPVGLHQINVVDTVSGLQANMSLPVYRSYNYANITLTNYAPLRGYIKSTANIQLPVLTWNTTEPGIYYVDTANNLDEYSFLTNSIVHVANVVPLSHTWTGYQIFSTLFWVVGNEKDRALFFGTYHGSSDLYLETVNLTNGNVLLINTNILAANVNSNAQADYIANNIAEVVCTNALVVMFNMSTGASWKGAQMSFFEANNEYWTPGLNSIINVQAEGSTADHVEQWQISGYNGMPTFTKVASFTFDTGKLINGVDGVVYDPTTREIMFSGGYFDTAPSVPSGSGQFTGTYIIHVAANGIIMPQNETRYATWLPIYDTYNYIHVGYTTTDGYVFGIRYYPDIDTFHIFDQRTSPMSITDTINPFVGGRSWIPIPIPDRWFFNTSWETSDGLAEFSYNNTNYGIAPVTLNTLQNGNVLTWFWNASMQEFPP